MLERKGALERKGKFNKADIYNGGGRLRTPTRHGKHPEASDIRELSLSPVLKEQGKECH